MSIATVTLNRWV